MSNEDEQRQDVARFFRHTKNSKNPYTQHIAAEITQLRNKVAELEADASGAHVLYTDEDRNPPHVITDLNGNVVLAMCKRCGQAEADLKPKCPMTRVAGMARGGFVPNNTRSGRWAGSANEIKDRYPDGERRTETPAALGMPYTNPQTPKISGRYTEECKANFIHTSGDANPLGENAGRRYAVVVDPYAALAEQFSGEYKRYEIPATPEQIQRYRQQLVDDYNWTPEEAARITRRFVEIPPAETAVPHSVSETTEILIGLLTQRDETGLKKYNQTLDRNDLSLEEWLQHMTEELLDGAGYAQAALREHRKNSKQKWRDEFMETVREARSVWLEENSSSEPHLEDVVTPFDQFLYGGEARTERTHQGNTFRAAMRDLKPKQTAVNSVFLDQTLSTPHGLARVFSFVDESDGSVTIRLYKLGA